MGAMGWLRDVLLGDAGFQTRSAGEPTSLSRAASSDCIAVAFSTSARAQSILLRVSSAAMMSNMTACQRMGQSSKQRRETQLVELGSRACGVKRQS